MHRATAGNPLFMQETVRALVTEHGEEALLSFTPAQIKPPEVARDVLGARLRSLPPDTRSLLATASVLGEEFELPLLQTVSGLALDELLKRIEYAVAQGLLEVESPQRRAFSHTLLRQVLYDDMKAADRVATHRGGGDRARGADLGRAAPQRNRAPLLLLAAGRRLRPGDRRRGARRGRRAGSSTRTPTRCATSAGRSRRRRSIRARRRASAPSSC